MKITHKTLAVVSGVLLVATVLFNTFATSKNKDTIGMVKENAVPRTSSSSSEIDNSPLLKEVKTETTTPNAVLDLHSKGLTEVPTMTFKRNKIEILDLSNNNLKGALQAEIRNMSSLVVLDLSDNMFTGVPAEVGQLSQLEVLDLSNNSITGLPYEIGNLKNLQTLDLRGNDYSTQDLEVIREGLPSTVEILVD